MNHSVFVAPFHYELNYIYFYSVSESIITIAVRKLNSDHFNFLLTPSGRSQLLMEKGFRIAKNDGSVLYCMLYYVIYSIEFLFKKKA